MSQAGNMKNAPESCLDSMEIVRSKFPYLMPGLSHIPATDLMCQVSYVDSHRARHGAQSVTSTGLLTRIRILFPEFTEKFCIFTSTFQTFHLPLKHNSGP